MADAPSIHPFRDLFDAAVRHRRVRLTCRECGHCAVFESAALWWLFQRRGWRDLFADVPRHFVCASCRTGRSAVARGPKLELVEQAPTVADLPLPPEHEWKRELRRRR